MEKGSEFTPEFSQEKKEDVLDKIIGRVSIMRHGETEYTEEYPDLTELGKEQIAESARKIKEEVGPNEDVLIASSPATRARGSADIIKRELGVEAENRILKSIRPIKIKDLEEGRETFAEFWGPGGLRREDLPKWDKFYATDPRFENRPKVQEPRSTAEKRSLRGLDYLIGFMSRYRASHPDRIPRLVAVSHFEFLNHLVRKPFSLDKDNIDELKFGEPIEITLLKSKENDAEVGKIPMLITFRGQTKRFIFDRKKRVAEAIEENS